MSTDYEIHTDLIDDSIEITAELKQAIQRVADVVVQYNRKTNRTKEDTDWLNTVVENFNFDQKYQAVRIKCTTPVELLDQFMKRRIVPQIKVVPHSSNKLYGIEFQTHYLDFQDFYKTNKAAFPKFDEFKQVLSLFLHNLHDELTKEQNHNDFFPYYPFHVNVGKNFHVIENKNPYAAYVLSLEWHNKLNLSGVSSKNGLNRIFASIITFYFPGLPFKFLHHSTWSYVFSYMGGGHKLPNTMDYLLRLVWRQVHLDFNKSDQTTNYPPDFYKPITRHIAWCENEYKRSCTKFHFECHSSVNCPFYRESLLKKQNKKTY